MNLLLSSRLVYAQRIAKGCIFRKKAWLWKGGGGLLVKIPINSWSRVIEQRLRAGKCPE